jgi:hypothetical protein
VTDTDTPRPRHPCELTADRLTEHLTRYDAHFTPAERAALRRSIGVLDQIADRVRADRDLARVGADDA